jgi:hypothetical protein
MEFCLGQATSHSHAFFPCFQAQVTENVVKQILFLLGLAFSCLDKILFSVLYFHSVILSLIKFH